MALIPATLQTGIQALLTNMAARTDNPAQAQADFAQQLATLIDTYIKTATVTVTVATTGTAAAQTGGGTGALT